MSWDRVHHSRDAILACLRAQCAPGRASGPVPRSGLAAGPGLDTASAVLLALLDPRLALAVVGSADAAQVGAAVRAATRAGAASVEQADFVLVDDLTASTVADRARRGTALVPERGATIVYCTPSAATPVTVEGPGVDGAAAVALALPAHELAALRRANASPPAGVDAFVVDGRALVALPRSLAVHGKVA